MTKQELNKVKELLLSLPQNLQEEVHFALTQTVVQETRSSQQNRAMHKWFEMVAQVCADAGLDAKVVMNNTASVQMNADIIKGMWRVMQEALYGTKSTTELSKAQQIDHIVDHFIRFFGEKFGLELPPFPTKDDPTYVGNTKVPYPTDYQQPTI
jgi:hypothetical protein